MLEYEETRKKMRNCNVQKNARGLVFTEIFESSFLEVGARCLECSNTWVNLNTTSRCLDVDFASCMQREVE